MLIITGLKKILKLHVNYSEYYKDKEQDEIQSAYFRHNSFSIFTTCCYTQGIDGILLKKITLSHEKPPTILELQNSYALIWL